MMGFESTIDFAAVTPVFVALVVWLVTACLHHVVRSMASRLVLIIPRTVAAWTVWLTLLRVTENLTGTSAFLPFPVLGLVAAIVSEIVFWCYAADQSPARGTPQRGLPMTPLLLLLRMVIVGILAIQLLQPTRSHEEEKREERTVAVVMDVSASMDLPARTARDDTHTRRQIAQKVLESPADNRRGLLDELSQRYDVALYQMDSRARRVPNDYLHTVEPDTTASADDSADVAQTTDFAAALRRINGDIPSSALSGVILLTDGCDHSDADLHDAVGFLETHEIPLNSVRIGSSEPIRDAEIVALQAPTQIYHGDELTLRAVVRADQFKGEVARLRLMEGDGIVEERDLLITSDRHRETIRFRHEPKEARLHSFRIELSGLDDDATPENDSATSQVGVSKDHIRVLIVEDRPRWEFRYLRNLFAGRDRSVFLQAVLLQPDRLAGVPEPLVKRASVLRAFDDCHANALPASKTEWLKFDVIVLGDVHPNHLGNEGTKVLETFVQDHGGSLVVVSGMNHMPHSYADTALRDLLPAKVTKSADVPAAEVEGRVRFRPTAEGLEHVVLERAGMNTKQAWASFPDLSWRHPAGEARIGATVLAYAADRNPAADVEQQRQRALMLWHRVGAGKVLQLNFDESWRLRYGIGDRIHHQFWGQIVRWCASDRLSVGTDLVRMGTDKVIYRVGETMRVKARLLDAQRNPVVDGEVRAVLLKGDEVVRSVELTPDPSQTGLLTGEIRDVKAGEAYRVELAGERVRQLLQLESVDPDPLGLAVGVRSIAAGNEALDVVADDTVLRQLADWTGGIVTSHEAADRILESLGPESSFQRWRWSTPLWNRWPVVLGFLSCLSFEWILRKVTGRV